MATAGRVLIMPKGTWVSGTTYHPLDLVYYGGNSFICKAEVTGTSTPIDDTTHWQQIASGFDMSLITQTITNDPNRIASDKAVYDEVQILEGNDASLSANKVNYTDALTMEEIEAASSLTNKVAAASAAKTLKDALSKAVSYTSIPANSSRVIDFSNYHHCTVIGGYGVSTAFVLSAYSNRAVFVATAGSITLTATCATNVLTITNSGGGSYTCTVIIS